MNTTSEAIQLPRYLPTQLECSRCECSHMIIFWGCDTPQRYCLCHSDYCWLACLLVDYEEIPF